MTDLWQRLTQRKLVQWALAYVAGAFALLQGVDIVAQRFGWPDAIERILIITICVGFFVALLLAWYHGEQGRQRASGAELLWIALVLAVGGGFLWKFEAVPAAHRMPVPASVAPAVSSAAPTSPDTTIPAKSIAVLPFVNMSGDPKNEYFSDGITQEILDTLAQVPNLKVVARTSAFAFKGKAEDLRKVGEALHVVTVLEGSVQRVGDQVRITAQLVDARSGYQLWSEKYDLELTNIFAVEDEISTAIATKLQLQLSGAAGQSLVAQRTIDPRAHDAYLRGLDLLVARGPGLHDAVAAFQNAVKIAPDYAQAWGAMAEAEALYPGYGLDSPQVAYRRSQEAAQNALALDPGVTSAHVAQGMVRTARWQWPQADQAFRRALALAPGDAEAVNQYAQFLLAAGQLESALRETDRAQRLDPLNKVNGVTRSYVLYTLHRYGAAWAQVQSTLAVYPDFTPARRYALAIAIALKNYPEIDKQARLYAPLIGSDPDTMAQAARGLADPGLHVRTGRSVGSSSKYARLRSDPINLALFLAQLGERNQALDKLEHAVDQADRIDAIAMWSPEFDSIRDEPRFKAVLKKMGLPYTPADGAAP